MWAWESQRCSWRLTVAAVEVEEFTLSQKNCFFLMLCFSESVHNSFTLPSKSSYLFKKKKKAIKKMLERVSIHTNGLTLLVIVAATTMTLFATPTDATRQTCPQNVEVPSITEVSLPMWDTGTSVGTTLLSDSS